MKGKPQSEPSKFKSYPPCLNKKEARMVCLNDQCHQYAFFCLQCEDESCEQVHRHENCQDKYISISFKEFIRRVLRDRKQLQQLEQAINTYRQTLERLRKDVNQFVDKEIQNLKDITKQATELPEDIQAIIKQLKDQQYTKLEGRQMDYVWKNCGDSTESKQKQLQTAAFIKVKEEELKAISQHFEDLNKMEIDKLEQSDLDGKKKSLDVKSTANKAANNKQKNQGKK